MGQRREGTELSNVVTFLRGVFSISNFWRVLQGLKGAHIFGRFNKISEGSRERNCRMSSMRLTFIYVSRKILKSS